MHMWRVSRGCWTLGFMRRCTETFPLLVTITMNVECPWRGWELMQWSSRMLNNYNQTYGVLELVLVATCSRLKGVGFPNQELISADMEPETLRKPGAATGNWGWTKQLLWAGVILWTLALEPFCRYWLKKPSPWGKNTGHQSTAWSGVGNFLPGNGLLNL